MNKPKYLQALELRQQGLSWAEIALALRVKVQRVKEYLYKARHLEKKLAQHRAHNRRYYYKDLEKSRRKSREYWRRDPERWQRERLVTVVNGKQVTLYHLNKRKRPGNCELCHNLRKRLYYHHWDGLDPSKGMWLCSNCHPFVSRVERGDVELYETLKSKIEAEICPRVEEKDGLSRLRGGKGE
jgi:hypothetical protein